jgi:hypothetical protein
VPDSRRHKSQPVMQPLLRRLDRVAEDINPVLMVLIIGLAILDLSVFAALELRNLPLTHVPAVSDDASPKPLTLGEAIGLPRR